VGLYVQCYTQMNNEHETGIPNNLNPPKMAHKSNLVFLFPQTNGRTCVNFGCTHQVDGLF
jgi:hypothetical protein